MWHCGGLGGTWTVDEPLKWKLHPGSSRETFGSIAAGRGHGVVAAQLISPDNRRLGVAAWMTSTARGEVGALNALARSASEVDSSLREDDYRAEIRAAAECGRRRLHL